MDILENNTVEAYLREGAEGRSWIHADLIFIDEDSYLITINAGQRVGNPNPHINFSYEPDRLITFIE